MEETLLFRHGPSAQVIQPPRRDQRSAAKPQSKQHSLSSIGWRRGPGRGGALHLIPAQKDPSSPRPSPPSAGREGENASAGCSSQAVNNFDYCSAKVRDSAFATLRRSTGEAFREKS